jgi:hypothetical protein
LLLLLLLPSLHLVSSENLGRLILAGVLMFVTGNGFVVWALQTVETHVVAIFAMIPIYTIALTAR